MHREPTREDVDEAVRIAQERGAGTEAWQRWARRWLAGIDPRTEKAQEAFDEDDDVAGLAAASALAAVCWLEARDAKTSAERFKMQVRCWSMLEHAGVSQFSFPRSRAVVR